MKNFDNKLIVILEGKIGNCFGCLYFAHKLAEDTGKEFVINSVNNINREASFYDLFSSENKFEHIENSITELNKIVPKDIPFLLHKSHYVQSGAIVDREVIYHREMSKDELTELIKSKKSVCYLDDASAHAMRNPDVMVETANKLLFKEDIIKQVNKFCLENNMDKNVKGVHIRATDWPWKQDCIDSAYKTIQDLVDKNPDERIFVCCDEEYIEDDLVSKLPNNIIVNKKNSYVQKAVEGSWREDVEAGDGRVMNYNTKIDVESAKEAIVDMLLLSRTDIRYRHQHSSFSWFSEIYSNVEELS